MENKYIIKNCPCRMELHENDCFGHTGYNNCCACTDCVLKQIVELCKDYYKNCEIEGNCIDDRTCTSCFFGGGNELAQDILSNLNIQEVE